MNFPSNQTDMEKRNEPSEVCAHHHKARGGGIEKVGEEETKRAANIKIQIEN